MSVFVCVCVYVCVCMCVCMCLSVCMCVCIQFVSNALGTIVLKLPLFVCDLI